VSGVGTRPPGAQSPFAQLRVLPACCKVVIAPFQRHYPPFFAYTGSCARPNPSHRLRLSPYTAGPCRLLSVPAGRWPFPTLGPASLSLDAWTCAPAAPKVHVPVPSFGTSAFPTCSLWIGYRKISHQAASRRERFSGPSSFLMFRPPVLLATLTAPTVMLSIRWRWLFHPSRTHVVSFTRIGYASRPNRAIDGIRTFT